MTTAAPPAGSGHQSLAFRVMRLCRPSFNVAAAPLLLDPLDLLAGEDDDSSSTPAVAAGADDLTFRDRFLLSDPSQAFPLSGQLVLPQSFGAIYLGETFSSYISINNSSKFEARDVIIKAEIQTEKQRIQLLDTTKSPVESIRAGGRYDFIVEHDVKELGAHTLVCTALYNDGDSERKYLPQFFKFVVANPLSVRTKVRTVKDSTFLEACIENHTKTTLFMDQVEFEPSPHWTVTVLKSDDHPTDSKDPTSDLFKVPALLKPGGGIHNYLYQLRSSSEETSQMKVGGSNNLGKLQITWRSNLGEPGRLQTQQILGSPVSQKEVELRVVKFPSSIIAERPFIMHLSLANQTDKQVGPFEVFLKDESNDEQIVMINGLQRLIISHLDAFCSMDFNLNLIAIRHGVRKISGLTVFDAILKKPLDLMPDLEIFVDRPDP